MPRSNRCAWLSVAGKPGIIRQDTFPTLDHQEPVGLAMKTTYSTLVLDAIAGVRPQQAPNRHCVPRKLSISGYFAALRAA
jgi:hypothetical protein